MAILEKSTKGAATYLELSRPEALNALSDELLAELQGALDDIRADRSIRVVVLSGAGKAFCAGHDLRQMQAGRQAEDGGAAYFSDLFTRCSKVMQGILDLPQPVIARVHGIATAAGCQLVASCDMAIAADGTRFGVNGVNIGLFCSTPMVALSRNIGRKKAFEMLTTGRFLSSAEAEAVGLVNRVVPQDQLDSAVHELAATLAGKLGSAVAVGKPAFYRQAEMELSKAYDFVREVMVHNMLHPDTNEGIQAFIEKRDPNWDQ